MPMSPRIFNSLGCYEWTVAGIGYRKHEVLQQQQQQQQSRGVDELILA